MASSYTPFDPHEFEMRRAVLSTERNNRHIVDITSSLVELIIFENLERPYLTGTVTYTDGGRTLEIMDFQGTELLEIEIALHTSPHIVKKSFIVREVTSVVPSTDTTDVITLALLDYDSYLNTLININKMYEGKPSQIINNILKDSFFSKKKIIRAGDRNVVSSLIDELDYITNPNADALNKSRQLAQELQSSFRYIVPNLTPIKAIDAITKRTTGLTGTPFFCFGTLADNDLRFYDLYTLLQQNPINQGDPFIYSSQLSQRTSSTGAEIARQVSELKSSQNGNTLALIMEGDLGSTYEFVDTTHGLEFRFQYDLEKVLQNLLQTGSYPAADTRAVFGNKSVSEYAAKRITSVATGNIYANNVKNMYEETSASKHSSKAIQKSIRNLLRRSSLTIQVPGLHMLPQDGHKTIGRVFSLISLADTELSDEAIDRKRSGDYLMFTAEHRFQANKYSVRSDLVKIANYRGNTNVAPKFTRATGSY